MKFVFKWAPELIDDLFESNRNYDTSVKVKLFEPIIFDDITEKIKDIQSILDSYLYNEFTSLLSQMKVTYEDKKTKTAEIQHPVFGKKNITENDIELIKMQDINLAYERMLKSDVRYRFVVDMSSLKVTDA